MSLLLSPNKPRASRFREDLCSASESLNSKVFRESVTHTKPQRVLQKQNKKSSTNEPRIEIPNISKRRSHPSLGKHKNHDILTIYNQQKAIAKSKAERYRFTQELRKEVERSNRRVRYRAGVIWGFDPNAGKMYNDTSEDESFFGCYIFPAVQEVGDQYGASEIDNLGRWTGRRWLSGSK